MSDKTMRIKGLRVYLSIFLAIMIGLLFFLPGIGLTGVKRSKPDKIKVGLIFSPSVPYQLRQALMKNFDSRQNMAVLCVNIGYRVFDKDMKTSSASEKIDQLIDIDADAVGLVYLDREEQEKCLKILSKRKIPSFVISRDTAPDSAKNACYCCYNDSNQAMNTAGYYIYSITEHKDRVAVITDTKPEHRKMALAFSGQYCAMAKMESMDIYAVNVSDVPQRFSVLSSSDEPHFFSFSGISALRELINIGRAKNAIPLCTEELNYYYCGSCSYGFYGSDGRCLKCGRYCPPSIPENALGNLKEEQNIGSAISQIEKSKIETLYVIGDVAPLIANRRLMNKGYKGVKMVATGCELLTLASIQGGNITANVEPNWREMGNKFFNAIDCHFNKKLNSGKESVSYIPKDFRYYNENSPLELPIGKGARTNLKR